jgi:tellurite resistance protein TehA-like permease
MGTGIVSILLHNLPYNGIWLYWISVVMFALNAALFCLFLLISVLRYTLYPEIWFVMIRHPAQSLFIGTFPMGLATIINMIVFVCVPAWGDWVIYLVRVQLRSPESADNIRHGVFGGLMLSYQWLRVSTFHS